MTVVVDGPEMEQIVKQLYKLVHTVKVTEFDPATTLEREIMLVRVKADPERRGEILDAARVSDAKAVDVGATTITFEVTGWPERLADFLELMSAYGVVALAKSGRIALAKDQKSAKKLKSA